MYILNLKVSVIGIFKAAWTLTFSSWNKKCLHLPRAEGNLCVAALQSASQICLSFYTTFIYIKCELLNLSDNYHQTTEFRYRAGWLKSMQQTEMQSKAWEIKQSHTVVLKKGIVSKKALISSVFESQWIILISQYWEWSDLHYYWRIH